MAVLYLLVIVKGFSRNDDVVRYKAKVMFPPSKDEQTILLMFDLKKSSCNMHKKFLDACGLTAGPPTLDIIGRVAAVGVEVPEDSSTGLPHPLFYTNFYTRHEAGRLPTIYFDWVNFPEPIDSRVLWPQEPMAPLEQKQPADPAYCKCTGSNVVKSYADGKEFLYCRDCKKERKR